MPHWEKEKNNFAFVGAAGDQEREWFISLSCEYF